MDYELPNNLRLVNEESSLKLGSLSQLYKESEGDKTERRPERRVQGERARRRGPPSAQ
jgi:hypothetical protein